MYASEITKIASRYSFASGVSRPLNLLPAALIRHASYVWAFSGNLSTLIHLPYFVCGTAMFNQTVILRISRPDGFSKISVHKKTIRLPCI